MGVFASTLKSVLSKVLSEHLVDQVIFELGLSKVRRNKATVLKKFKGKKNFKANVGCGESGKEGWVNIDGFHTVNVDARWDCRTDLPFENDSVTHIFTEHFFEHIDYDTEAPKLVKDFYRVLQKGGVIRMVVPDAEKFVRGYVSEGWDVLTEVRPLKKDHVDFYTGYKYKTKMELVNHIFRQHYQHKFAYDFETLKVLFEEAGFTNIIKSDYGISTVPEFNIDIQARASESLYLEATKA